MRLRTSLQWVLGGVLVMVIAGSATAQQPANTGGKPADASVGFQRVPQLAPEEQLQQSSVFVTRMEQGAATVRRQLETARTQRDVIKTLCLNDKLSQIDVAIRSARERKASLQNAVNRKDTELSNHEFTILFVLKQRADQLITEANQCIGEEAGFIGKTEVITRVDPNLPESDDTQYPPTDPTLISAPPQCVSCAN
jgi:hypothetical protein